MLVDSLDVKKQKNTKLYYCDPSKNKKCSKTWCYLKGGECFLTTDKKNSMLKEVVF